LFVALQRAPQRTQAHLAAALLWLVVMTVV
jgi:hypothetical protein